MIPRSGREGSRWMLRRDARTRYRKISPIAKTTANAPKATTAILK
jgi:hypothetical protein